MSRQCQITGKKTTAGNNRPFSLKATKRKFFPNLFKRRVKNPETGKVETMKLSAKAIKTMKKKGLIVNEYAATPEQKAAKKASAPSKAGEGKHVKKEKLTPKQKKELAAKKEEEAKTKTVAEEKIEAKETEKSEETEA